MGNASSEVVKLAVFDNISSFKLGFGRLRSISYSSPMISMTSAHIGAKGSRPTLDNERSAVALNRDGHEVQPCQRPGILESRKHGSENAGACIEPSMILGTPLAGNLRSASKL